MIDSKKQRSRLRRRIAGYQRYPIAVLTLETDFQSIFSPICIRHGWGGSKPIKEIIEECSDEEVM